MKPPQDMDKQMGVMQESMLKMYKIMDAKSPQERERLMRAHREIMRQHRQDMSSRCRQKKNVSGRLSPFPDVNHAHFSRRLIS